MLKNIRRVFLFIVCSITIVKDYPLYYRLFFMSNFLQVTVFNML